ncbi:hypothetical protein [Microbaculum sp. FT89]|uniref:hypothetical protein n=1 Tax=Microbaculum sp. FT89 TaxID=3447298 RepID=UPI003F53CA34
MAEVFWFGAPEDQSRTVAFGFRLTGGGAHQSKTMMLQEIEALLATQRAAADEMKQAAIDENALGKKTANTRRLTFRHLSSLYGLIEQPPLTQALFGLWKVDADGRPLLALLVSLARDPMLRSTANVILEASYGQRLERVSFEEALADAHPDRFSEKMIRSMAQNCAATWTQSGHLKGTVKKYRQRVSPTPAAVALAALLATVAGFGGPAVLGSVWMQVLDLSPEQALDQLRRAEAQGLARVRSAGDVTEISIRQPMSATLGVRQLEYV